MQDVAIGILLEREKRILIGKRRLGNRSEHRWEFPGGKVEAYETPEQALCRELAEELGIEVIAFEHLLTLEHCYSDGSQFRLWCFLVPIWKGSINSAVWDEAAWVTLDMLERYPLFEANRRIIPHLDARLAMSPDERYMKVALDLAESAARRDEVPVGCIIVRDGAIIGAAHNRTEALANATAHAEILAINDAMQTIGSKWLEGATLYVTLEPCPMCAGAIVLARIARVVFGAHDPKAGACETLFTLTSDRRLNHRAQVRGGVLAERAEALLQEFFRRRR